MLRGRALATDSRKISMGDNITDPKPRCSEDVVLGVSDSAVQSPGGHYKYEPINTKAADTFRLLLLEPGTWEDPLKGIILVARQADGIDYAALSYVWGETTRQELISIDGKQLTIGANLSMFLHHLRNPDQTLTLWIDAVCIDQENLSERGHQVRLMGDIYRNASNVYAWLGEDTHGIATLTSFLSEQAVSRASEEAPKPPPFKGKTREVARHLITGRKPPTRVVKTTGDETNKHIVESRNPYKLIDAVNKTIDGLENHARRVFVDLCKRPYWTRVWIIQELLLARSVIICLGQKRIAWKSFSTTIESCALQWPAVIWPIACGINSVQSLIEMMELPVKDRCSTLEELLRRYNQQECLDTRDRIYALLSLSRDCDTIIPDYTKNRLDLFFQVKGTVRNGPLLRGALELYTDEIMYRAETLGIPYKAATDYLSVKINPGTGNVSQSVGESFDRAIQLSKHRVWAGMFDDYTKWGRTLRTVTMDESHVVCEKHQTMRVRQYSYPHRWEVKLESGVTGILLATDLELWEPASGMWRRADSLPNSMKKASP